MNKLIVMCSHNECYSVMKSNKQMINITQKYFKTILKEARDKGRMQDSIYVKFQNGPYEPVVVERKLAVALNQDLGEDGWMVHKGFGETGGSSGHVLYFDG